MRIRKHYWSVPKESAMKLMKPGLIRLSGLALIAMPLLSACGGEAATATPAPAAATTAPVAATNTPAMTGAATATTAMTGGGGGLTDLAAEGIKPDAAAKGNFEFFSWWTAGGE